MRQAAGMRGVVAIIAGLWAAAAVAADTASGPARVVTVDAGAKQPQVAVDEAGAVHVVFGVGNRIRLASTRDGGTTFAVRDVAAPKTLALGMRRGPRVVATKGAIVVTAVAGDRGKGQDGDILAWRSTDGGASWQGPTRLNAVVGSGREGLHAMAAAPDGTIFCTWIDLRNNHSELFGAVSRDAGATWQPDALVYHSPDAGGSICPCCHPSAAFGPDGTLVVMWRNNLAGARDLYLARSADRGQTFSAAEKLGRGTWMLGICPMDGGAVGVGPGGRVDTVWMRAGTLYADRPGEPEVKLGPGIQGWLAPGPDGPRLVWLEKRAGRLLTRGPGDESPVVLAEKATDPVVATSADGRGPVYAAWEANDEPGGLRLVRLGHR